MEALLSYILEALVNEPEEVEIYPGARGLEFSVAEVDRGLVIGRQGRTIRAMELLLNVTTGNKGLVGLRLRDSQ